jgi:hypothetical protein
MAGRCRLCYSHEGMVPTFTIVTTIITIAVTALLIALFYRINNPVGKQSRDGGGDAGTTFVTAGRGNRHDDGDAGSDGGGDGGGD